MTDILDDGIRCFQSGDLVQARQLLAQAAATRPRSPEAWLWLGRALEDVSKQRFCFQRALELDPDNLPAAEALVALDYPTKPTPILDSPPGVPPPTPPAPLLSHPDTVAAIAARMQSPPPLPSPVPAAETPKAAIEASKPVKRPSRLEILIASLSGDPLLFGLAGLVLALILVAVPAISLVNGGAFDGIIPVSQSPEMVAQLSASLLHITQTALAPNAALATFTSTPTLVNTHPAKTATPSLPGSGAGAASPGDGISILLSQGRYAAAIALLDQHIAAHPDDGVAFSRRGQAYLHLLEDAHLYTNDENRDMLTRSINNLDKAIELGPTNADDFYYRGLVYARLADEYYFYQVNRDQAHALAIENFQAAEALGTRIPGVKFDLAFALAYAGRCDLAEQTANAIAETKQPGFDYARFSDLFSAINLCQGHIASAIADKQGAIDHLETCDRDTDLAYLQYNQGTPVDALDTLARSIAHCPSSGGMRYYLRALLYYESGQKNLVQSELDMGASNTWFGGGTYVYMLGKLALDAGEREKGIQLLQQAEASMTFREGPALLAKVRHDLDALGAPRMKATPALDQSTPIPSALLTPAAPTASPMASPTATSATPSVFKNTATPAFPSATSSPSPTPGPSRTPIGRVPPPGSEWATAVDINHGTGNITLKPGDSTLFHFKLSNPIQVQAGTALTFMIDTPNVGASPLQMQIWMPGYGWQMINVKQDILEVPMPELIVLPDGDLYAKLINKSAVPIEIKKAGFGLTVRLVDGSLQLYGSMD